MSKYTNKYCKEVARLGRLEGLTYRLNALIKLNDTTLHELDDEIESIKITIEELEKEIKQAFIHGQGNKEMMEAGLERDETEDYVNSRMRKLLNQNKDENNTP
jgi:hypothetical protein